MFISRIKHLIIITILSLAVVYAAVDIVPANTGYVFTDSMYSAIYYKTGEEQIKLISAPGVGRFFTLSADERFVGFKYREMPGGKEAPAMIDLQNAKMTKLHDDVALAGQVSFADNGSIAYTIDERLFVKNADGVRKYNLGNYANLAPISPNAEMVVYNDESGQLWVLHLEDGDKEQITFGAYEKVFPQWSKDSKHISFQSLDGHIKIFHLESQNISDLGMGGDLKWSDKETQFAYTQVDTKDEIEISGTKVILANTQGDIFYNSAQNVNESRPYFDHDMNLNFYRNGKRVSMQDKPSLFKKVGDADEFKTSPVSFAYEAVAADSFLNVPYIHQVYDTPGERGYSSCAPTTAAMIMGYYNILPKWPFVSGWGNTSQYGAYVHEKYRYRGTTYDLLHTDCNSSGSYCYSEYGGMGFMWTGGSPNSKMLNYYQRHGMTGNQTWSTNWTTVSNEIDKKKPYSICNYLSGGGHLIAAIGRVSSGQRTVIANDPYGDRNRSSWPNYYGRTVYYDWPGYNHGHASLNYANSGVSSMPWCIATSYTAPTFVDSIIDDRQFEDGFFMKAEGNTVPMRYYRSENNGHNGHHWWTYTEASNEDICYVTWTPKLDSAGFYEIFTYTPSAATATTAQYRIHHTAGESRVVVDQTANPDTWVSLGKYLFRNDGSDYVYLGDSTGTGSQKVAFDDMKWRPVEVQDLDFTSDYTNGYPGFELRFWVDSPISEGDYEYTWNFGDGESATGDTVIHVYESTGSFTVTLSAETGGISMNKMKEDLITINENSNGLEVASPQMYEVVTTARPTITWDFFVMPSEIYVMLDETPEFSDPDSTYYFEGVLTHCNIPIDLPENKNIYCKIFVHSGGEVSESKVSVFKVNATNSLPLDFSLLSPMDMFIADTLRPEFTWEKSSDKDPGDSLNYKLYIGTSLDSMEAVYYGPELSYRLNKDLMENGCYQWYVEAVDQTSALKRSTDIRKISINTYNEAPSAVRQLSPAHNSYQTTRYPYIEWTQSIDPDPGDEISYKVFYWYEGGSVKYINEDTTYHDHRRFSDQRAYFWTVAAIDKDEVYTYSDTLTVYIDSELDVSEIPGSYVLKGNYPNPFNPITTITYAVPATETVVITLYDLSGKMVRTLRNGVHQPGHYALTLDASELASGIYVYKMTAGQFSASSKMLLLK